MEKLSSTKLVPGVKKIEDHCPRKTIKNLGILDDSELEMCVGGLWENASFPSAVGQGDPRWLKDLGTPEEEYNLIT